MKSSSALPVVVAAMIVKNEERDLPRALRSIAQIVDRVVILDTGSTDATERVARSVGMPMHFSTFLSASRQDQSGDWQLWDFSKARNEAIEIAEFACRADWILWLDADDEVLSPWLLAGAMLKSNADILAVTIASGEHRWTQHRAWRANLGIRFVGRCHEYPNFGAAEALTLPDCVIRHHADPKPGEGSAQRNLRILLDEWESGIRTTRGAFYIANTYRDLGKWKKAATWYEERIAAGAGYRDEFVFAYLYLARCLRAAGSYIAARDALDRGWRLAPAWAEFPMERAYIAADAGDWQEASRYAHAALHCEITPTLLWREPDKYDVEPVKMIERCVGRAVIAT